MWAIRCLILRWWSVIVVVVIGVVGSPMSAWRGVPVFWARWASFTGFSWQASSCDCSRDCGLSGVRLALLLLEGLLLVALLGGERLGEGEIDICLSGELISALRFLCGVCGSTCCILFCWRGWRSVRTSFPASFYSKVVLYFAFST